MVDYSEPVIAVCTVIGCLIAVGGLIARYERRSAKTAALATSAMKTAEATVQTSAEAEEAVKELALTIQRLGTDFAVSIGKIEREILDTYDRVRREFGETVQAMQKKIQEFEKWSRDEFVHVKSFDEALARLERSAEQRDVRMEKRFDRIERKIDENGARWGRGSPADG